MDSDILYNQTMIRKLKATKKLHDSNITNALYSVNRSWFMPLRINDGTYEDIEYRSPSWFYYSDVPIHLFSPSLYVTILKQMDFQHGHSFLNIGSGTGYLSCLAGCLIGSSGKNVGIELQASLVHFAFIQRQKVIAFLEEADWGLPEILCLNIFEYKTKEKYDRIFVGASVKEHHRTFICRMLKNYGVAILAYYNELQKITNIGDNQYIVQTIEEVDFDEILEDDCKMPVKSCVYKPRETLDEWKKKGKMKNTVWEICQDYEAEFFIDYINGNACFYTFEEKANSAIKLIVGKYQIKYETRMMKQKQEKEAEKFGQELRKLKENQRMMEEKIEKVIADKENQDLEIKEFMKNENTSTADKIKNAKEFYGITDERSFNFAIAGHTKTGKSSLINAFRGINDKSPMAAKVGITETTNKVQKYEFLMNECKNITVNLYDVPGSGTLTHDAKNYYQEKHLCAFDCLFILVQETFCKEEIEIAKEALKHNQTIAFIHSKCDIFLTNKKKQKLIKKIDQKAVDDCLNELKLNYITEIRKSKILKLQKIPCFYVNSFNLYDLKNDIISEPNVKYQEKELIEFMTSEVKYSRNIIT